MFDLYAAAEAVLVACPTTSNLKVRPGPRERAARRAEQTRHGHRDRAALQARSRRGRRDPFGHTRPNGSPFGGTATVDNTTQTLWADS